MKKAYLSLSIIVLLLTFVLLPAVKAGSRETKVSPSAPVAEVVASETATLEASSNKLYDTLQLDKIGLSKEALLYALKGQETLRKKGELNNADVLTVCDFSQPSTSKRMYIIDLKNVRVLMNTFVAHGRNSGLDFAERFSNKMESLQSSLGFYVTKQTYMGKHGLSLRLSGKDRGFNDNAERRAVVVHGAQYIGESRADAAYMGRSFGCPAVPQAQSAKVINLIKNGTCLFVYHPSSSYLHGSKILNG